MKCQQNIVIEFVTRPDQLFLLTVIFSRGEPLPVHCLEPGQIGSNFVDFVLEVIEKPVQKRSHDLSDVFIGMMLSYNLQFQDNTSNVFIDRQVQAVYIESSVTMDLVATSSITDQFYVTSRQIATLDVTTSKLSAK